MKKILFLILCCFPLATILAPAPLKGAEVQSEAPAQEKAPAPRKSFSSVEERRLYTTLEQERAGLQEKIKVLADREKELKTLEQEVDKKFEQMDQKLQELKKLQQTTEELLARKDQAELKMIQDLSNIYSKMAPEKAALALSSLEDQQLAADLITNMKTKSAARILEQLNKLQVSALTTTLSTLSSE
ncbi:MAG: hypothetical protein K0A99_10140 [Desulfoarculaceae bacterium]|nr:hypothetical protein [Desulfoarculaceae bacterium]